VEGLEELSNHVNVAPPVVLTIAGFDPSAGAGTAADLKTIAAHNCYGVAAITALTVQSTQGVKSVHDTPASELRAQLDALLEDIKISAIKIGTKPKLEINWEVLQSSDLMTSFSSWQQPEGISIPPQQGLVFPNKATS